MFGDSQLFFGSQSATQAAPEAKKAKSDDNQSCLPVTLRILEDALAERSGNDELQIHGTQPSMLLLIGTIETLSRQTHSLEFSLNDGTGRIKAKYFSHGEDLSDVQLGKYVCVVGNARSAPALHFAVTFMRLVSSPDEVSHHMIEAAHAALKLKKNMLVPATPMPQKRGADTTPEKISEPIMQTTMPTRPVQSQLLEAAPAPAEVPQKKLEGPALQAAVLAYIQREGEGKQEGVGLAAVVQSLGSTPAADINAVLEQLVDAGEVFNTTDEEHFSAL